MGFTDEQWAALEPLVEAARPKGKTRPRGLRRTMEAIVWRHRNGAKWRASRPSSAPGGGPPSCSSAGRGWGAWRRLLETAQGARGRARHGVPRRDQHQGAPQGRGRAQKGGTGAQRDRRRRWGGARGLRHEGVRRRGRAGPRGSLRAGARGRRTSCRWRRGSSTGSRACRCGSWATAATARTPSAISIWGKGARPAIPTRSNERPWPAPTTSTTTAASSSGSGTSSRSGGPSPPATRGARPLPRRPLPRRRHGLAQALTGPRACYGSE